MKTKIREVKYKAPSYMKVVLIKIKKKEDKQ